jgi:hypothetical protein
MTKLILICCPPHSNMPFMNKITPGHHLFEANLGKDQHILPVGLISLACVTHQEPSMLNSALLGIRQLLAALAERSQAGHSLNMQQAANCLCGIGLILEEREALALSEEMETSAQSMGGNFAAFYQASTTLRIPQDRPRHVEEFLSAYNHVLYTVMQDWSITRMRDVLAHAITQLDTVIAGLPVPHSQARARELSEQMGLPVEMQAIAQRLIQLTTMGMLAHSPARSTEPTSQELSNARNMEMFITAGLYQSSASDMSGRLWGHALTLIAGVGLDDAVIHRAMKKPGRFRPLRAERVVSWRPER